ncbi:Asp23/Gls24 family envelope stress response protein [Arthrobacter sp. H35-D1]|uniref:Asp23/Gls24 family envelope stress response protein n=1 Tax=Arthrobacter sp. H35-D1 TaxID=3046202 RepID=UPI0024BA763B|nr:Asp23/Gls24 family envelope stress response protein [Arthrobacter sp. H35-D1]MDJ0314814.1 Asp23/Gls24 family envelope stress response protein [Arthrobacter sp. H35-D1]
MNPQGAQAQSLDTRKDPVAGSIDARGHTVLANKVVEKIASQVAGDEAVAGGSSGGFLGIGAHADLTSRPKVSVELSGNMATLRVDVGMLYPAPLRQATEDLRQRIRDRVMELTGVEVRHVDIKVSWLTTADADAGGERKLL